MRRFFAQNILFVVFVNLLVKPIWIFFIDRTVQNRVGNDYGTYQALMNLGVIFQILLDFGINNYTTKTIAENPLGIKKLFPALLTTRLLLGLLYAVLLFSIAFSLGYADKELYLLAGISCIQLFNSTLQFVRSNVSGLHKFKLDGLLSVMDKILMIILCGCLLYYYRSGFKIEWFVAAQMICYGLAVAIGLVLLKMKAHVPLRLSFNTALVWYHVRKSLPYAILIFLMSVYTRVDMLMVERMSGEMGKQEAGIYAAAYRLLDVGNMVGLMVAGMLLPIFGGMIARKENMQSLVRLCVNILLPVSFLVMVIAVFFKYEIMEFLYPSLPVTKAVVFVWLMAAFPAFSISNVYSTLLTANGNLKLMIKVALVGVVINIVMNAVLIPYYHAWGAAISACTTQTIIAFVFLFFAKKELILKEDFKWVFSFFYYLALLLVLGFVITKLDVSWIVQLTIMAIAGIAMIFLLRFLDVRELKKLIKKNH